jgi:hypothetical protein
MQRLRVDCYGQRFRSRYANILEKLTCYGCNVCNGFIRGHIAPPNINKIGAQITLARDGIDPDRL